MKYAELFAAIVVLAPAFAGCGGEEPPPPQAPPPPPPVASAPPPPASTAETPPPPPPKPTMADLVPATLKNITDAFNAHDAQKFAANYTPDAVSVHYGVGEMHGRDEIAKSLQAFFDASSDAKGGAAHMFVRGNSVAVDWVTVGTMTGDFMGIKASKKPIGHHQLVVGTLGDDGLMTQSRIYADGPGMMEQMKGAKNAPPVPELPTTTETHWAKNTPDEDKLVEWMKSLNDTFNKDDAKAVSDAFAPDGDVTCLFLGGKVVKAGKEMEKSHGELFKAIPKAQFSIVNAWAADGFVVAERTVTGTMKGRMGPVPPTNKEVTVHMAEVFLPNADGKISHAWAFGNLGELMPPKPMKEKEKEKGAAKDKGAAAPAAAPKP